MKKIFLLRLILCATCVAMLGAATPATAMWQGGRASVYYREGARFALEGRLQEAVAAFEQAIALDPKDGNAYYSLGNVYAELGRWDDAVGVYRRAISLNKKDVEAYNGLGIALARQRLYGQSVEAFEHAVELAPKWAEPRLRLSEVYRQLGRDVAAQVAYDEAIRLRPDYATNPPATFMATQLKTDAPAANERASAATATPTMGNRVAVSSKLPNNNDDASPPRTRTATPDSTVPPRNATRKTGERVNAPAAITTTTIAATSVNPSVTPTDAKALYDLGIEYAGAGRYEEAVAAYRRSIVLDNNDAETYFALGTAYTKLGRWRESVDAYEQVVRLNPKDAEAYERLGRSYAKLRETSSPNTTPGTTADGGEAAVGIKAASSSGASSNGTTEPRSERTTTMTDGAARPATNMTRIMNRTASNTTTTNAPPPSSASAARMASNNSSQPANAATTATDNFDPSAVYRVGPGDVLEVNVRNGRASAVTAHAVTTAGLLDYPSLAEPLEVAGLTTDEIASRLTAQLQRRANASAAAPQVAVGVRDYVSHAIIVSGLVKDSGTKILRREGVPLYVVVASAQPLPEAGRALVMSHATNRSTTIDLSDARAMNMLVRPGDVITVQASTKQYFYIAGAIRQPGQKEFHVGLTLTQAILAAGGVMSPQSSSSTVVNIARQGADGRLATTRYDIKDIEAGKVPDPGLQPGDRIEVAR